jgi:hypothetical protein
MGDHCWYLYTLRGTRSDLGKLGGGVEESVCVCNLIMNCYWVGSEVLDFSSVLVQQIT